MLYLDELEDDELEPAGVQNTIIQGQPVIKPQPPEELKPLEEEGELALDKTLDEAGWFNIAPAFKGPLSSLERGKTVFDLTKSTYTRIPTTFDKPEDKFAEELDEVLFSDSMEKEDRDNFLAESFKRIARNDQGFREWFSSLDPSVKRTVTSKEAQIEFLSGKYDDIVSSRGAFRNWIESSFVDVPFGVAASLSAGGPQEIGKMVVGGAGGLLGGVAAAKALGNTLFKIKMPLAYAAGTVLKGAAHFVGFMLAYSAAEQAIKKKVGEETEPFSQILEHSLMSLGDALFVIPAGLSGFMVWKRPASTWSKAILNRDFKIEERELKGFKESLSKAFEDPDFLKGELEVKEIKPEKKEIKPQAEKIKPERIEEPVAPILEESITYEQGSLGEKLVTEGGTKAGISDLAAEGAFGLEERVNDEGKKYYVADKTKTLQTPEEIRGELVETHKKIMDSRKTLMEKMQYIFSQMLDSSDLSKTYNSELLGIFTRDLELADHAFINLRDVFLDPNFDNVIGDYIRGEGKNPIGKISKEALAALDWIPEGERTAWYQKLGDNYIEMKKRIMSSVRELGQPVGEMEGHINQNHSINRIRKNPKDWYNDALKFFDDRTFYDQYNKRIEKSFSRLEKINNKLKKTLNDLVFKDPNSPLTENLANLIDAISKKDLNLKKVLETVFLDAKDDLKRDLAKIKDELKTALKPRWNALSEEQKLNFKKDFLLGRKEGKSTSGKKISKTKGMLGSLEKGSEQLFGQGGVKGAWMNERIIHFKNQENARIYQDKWGSPGKPNTVMGSILPYIRGQSRALALYDKFGHNPHESIVQLLNHIKRSIGEKGMSTVEGKLYGILDNWRLNKFEGGMGNINEFSNLSSAVLAQIEAGSKAYATKNNYVYPIVMDSMMSLFLDRTYGTADLGEAFKAMLDLTKSAPGKNALKQLGMLHAFISEFDDINNPDIYRFRDEKSMQKAVAVRKMLSSINFGTLMSNHNRKIIGLQTMSLSGRVLESGESFANVSQQFKRFMKLAGLTEREYNFAKKHKNILLSKMGIDPAIEKITGGHFIANMEEARTKLDKAFESGEISQQDALKLKNIIKKFDKGHEKIIKRIVIQGDSGSREFIPGVKNKQIKKIIDSAMPFMGWAFEDIANGIENMDWRISENKGYGHAMAGYFMQRFAIGSMIYMFRLLEKGRLPPNVATTNGLKDFIANSIIMGGALNFGQDSILDIFNTGFNMSAGSGLETFGTAVGGALGAPIAGKKAAETVKNIFKAGKHAWDYEWDKVGRDIEQLVPLKNWNGFGAGYFVRNRLLTDNIVSKMIPEYEYLLERQATAAAERGTPYFIRPGQFSAG